jgi:cell shape-determining protein MreD
MSNGQTEIQRKRHGGLMGPVVLITIGVLFLIGKLELGYSFNQLWPVLLIVIGLVKLFESTRARNEGSGS